MEPFLKNRQYYKFCSYGFLKNLRFFDAFFILFLVEKGFSFTQIGVLYAVREIVTNILELPSGIIADSLGRKSSLAASLLIYILSFTLFFLSEEFWIFLIAMGLFGAGEAFRTGTHKGMIMDYLKLMGWEKHAGNYYGHTRSWSQRGSAISALLAGIIVFFGGTYKVVFLYSIVPYLLNFLLILSYPGELNRSPFKNLSGKTVKIGDTIRSFVEVIRLRPVVHIIYSSAVHTAYLRAMKDYIQVVMLNLVVLIPFLVYIDPEKKNGLFIGILYFFIFLATSRASGKSARIAERSRRNIAYLTLLAGFFAGIVSGVSFQYGIWIISFLAFAAIYVVENIRKPILTGAMAKEVPEEILTSVISAQSLLRTVLTSLIALTFGIIADHAGIGISLVAIPLLLTLSIIIAKTLNNRF